ncbi:MAG: tRNA pseudouridine(38-40) synthase TruA [Candidatus Hodarchaeaceae archaeon]|nr:tRNA pseudouridine(38-40) synthase TruA [Candidatus Hodarchaeaceae archaeon]
MRYAFLVAYDGTRYFGFARQPGLSTVEAELLRAFERFEFYRELSHARYRVAARTDRGVSALGQVIALDALKRPNLRALNASLPPDIAILGATKVEPSFDPRGQAMRKHYRYICEAPKGFNPNKARAAAALLVGTHDFRNFCKREKGRSTEAKLERASVRGGKILTFDFAAKAFLWQQVRRLVNALLAVGTGRMTIARLREMLDGRMDAPIAPAPPEGLILMKIEYPGLKLEPNPPLAPKFLNLLKRERAHHMRRAVIYECLLRAIVKT